MDVGFGAMSAEKAEAKDSSVASIAPLTAATARVAEATNGAGGIAAEAVRAAGGATTTTASSSAKDHPRPATAEPPREEDPTEHWPALGEATAPRNAKPMSGEARRAAVAVLSIPDEPAALVRPATDGSEAKGGGAGRKSPVAAAASAEEEAMPAMAFGAFGGDDDGGAKKRDMAEDNANACVCDGGADADHPDDTTTAG